jgi:uncharacterized protein (DUF1697 family)
MPTFVILLRAVNVGGTGKLTMASFRKLLEDLGYRKVETYIQSGNAVVDAPGSASSVRKAIAVALEKLTGAPAGVMVRTRDQLDKIINGNPFATEAAADGARVHVSFLAGPATSSAKASLERIVTRYPTRRDRFHLVGDTLYLHLPEGAAETKFTGKTLERALSGIAGTGRNWNTVVKLHEISKR